nr:hypothetical protein [uncultured Actinoplanes sp.]
MTVTEAPSARMTALAAWSKMQAVRAQLRADVAAGADVQLVAADKAAILSLQQQIAHSAGRIDVTV